MSVVALYQTAANFSNASNSVLSGFGSMSSLVGPLILAVWGVIIVALVSALQNNEYFQHIVTALGWVATTIEYALHGLAALVVGTVIMAPAYFVATADPSTRSAVGELAIAGLVGYAVLAGLGYVIKHRVADPIRDNIDDAMPEDADNEAGSSSEVSD